jgi:hypothetical protein
MSSIRLRLFTGLALIGSLGVSALLRSPPDAVQAPRIERAVRHEELTRTAQLSGDELARARQRAFSAGAKRGVE